MRTKFFTLTIFILYHGISLAENAPNSQMSRTTTAEQAAAMVREHAQSKKYYLRVNWLTSIDRDVARELAKHGRNINSDHLTLDGLTSIDKAVARELSRFQGYELSLDGLTSMDLDVAQSLAKFQGAKLSLDGLADTDKETVKELAKFKGDWLVLGVTSLDKEDAREFAKGQGNGLSFDRLSSIDKEVAHELSRFMGFTLSLDGLTSISKDVAHELAKLRPRYSNTPSKCLRLDGLTSISKEVAQELAKFPGQLMLNHLKSMNSEVARAFAQYRGNRLEIIRLESIALDDLNMLKSALQKPVYEDTHSFGGHRYNFARKLKDGTDISKKNGKLIQFHQDGSKMTETVYTNSYVVSRTEWNEEGKLTKAEKYAVDGFFGMEGQSVDTDQENKDPQDSTVQLSETPQDSSPPSTPNVAKPEREYLPQDIIFQAGIPYLRGENEPFTGICVVNWQSGSKRLETRYQNGKPVLKSTWDEDGNLIEKETY